MAKISESVCNVCSLRSREGGDLNNFSSSCIASMLGGLGTADDLVG